MGYKNYLLGGGGGKVKFSGGNKKDFTLDWLDSDSPSKVAISSAHYRDSK